MGGCLLRREEKREGGDDGEAEGCNSFDDFRNLLQYVTFVQCIASNGRSNYYSTGGAWLFYNELTCVTSLVVHDVHGADKPGRTHRDETFR